MTMTISRSISVITFLFVSIIAYGQAVPGKTIKKSYCPTIRCTLKPDDPAHFDPYYNHHLCENFNPEQTDFSKEYFELQTRSYKNEIGQLQQTLSFDYSPIWTTNNLRQNGVLGLNYQRIQ